MSSRDLKKISIFKKWILRSKGKIAWVGTADTRAGFTSKSDCKVTQGAWRWKEGPRRKLEPVSACWAGAGPPPTRSPRTPARPSALTESSARCPRAGGGTARTGKRARRRDGRRNRAGPLQSLISKASQNRPACILPHSHFRKLSRQPGGLTALWSARVVTEHCAFWLSAAPGGCLRRCWECGHP